MRKILYLLLALLLLIGCRSKKSNRTEHREEQRSERKEVKDSATHIEKSQKVATFELQQSRSYEITLESDKDSMQVNSEKRIVKNEQGDIAYIQQIKVKGGKATIKVNHEERKVNSEIYNTLQENTTTSQQQATIVQEHRQTTKSQKQVSALPWWLIASTLLLGLLIFIFIRFKR